MNYLKNQTLSILLIFTIVAALTLIFIIPTAKAASTLQVPSANYPTIQSALNTAKDGDTIKIAAGTYNENINYDGYAIAVASGSSQPKTGVTLQGSEGTVINGAVGLLYLKQFKIERITVTGGLTLGDCRAYGYFTGGVVSNVQVGSTLAIGGPDNKVIGSTVNTLTLKGGNTKTEFPSFNTIIENNRMNGIIIQAGSYANTIKSSTISQGKTGIYEEPSKTYYTTGNNQIINNTIADNEVGISLYCSTGDNGAVSHNADTVAQNVFRDNAVGLELSASNQYVYGNTIYHNDFIDNSIQIKINNPVTNTWDDGSGKGNYWSTYTGKDGNGDGIGDTPFTINTENHDSYPLMKPWSIPTSLSATSTPSSSQSANQASSSPANVDPSQTPLATAPEFTPFFAAAGLVVVSLLALFFLKRGKTVF